MHNYLLENVILLWIIIPIVIVLLIIGLIVIVLHNNKSKFKVKIDESFINELLNSLGGKENIENVLIDNGRLKFSLTSLDSANLENLKTLSNSGVFVTGNIVKTLFKYDSAAIKKALDSLI